MSAAWIWLLTGQTTLRGRNTKFTPPEGLMANAAQSCVPGRPESGKSPVLHSISCFLLLSPLLPSQHCFSSSLQGQFLEAKMVLQASLSTQLRVLVVADNLSTNILRI